MYIEGIGLKHFSALPNSDINTTTPSHKLHTVFHSFLSDDSEQDAATTNAQSNHLIPLLKEKHIDNIIEYNMGKH